MKRCQAWRVLWSLLALLALGALNAPAPLWACPMTGRIGNAELVCRDMAPATPDTPSAPCAQSGRGCCKHLPFPLLPFNFDDARNQNALSGAVGGSTLPPVVVWAPIASLPLVELAPLIVESPRPSPVAASPPFISLNRPAPRASRAPPVALLS